MTGLIWLDDQLVAADSATVPLTADAVLRGINVFEGLLAYRWPREDQYAVISSERHLERLVRSAELMHLPTPLLARRVISAIGELLAHQYAEQVYLRPTLYLKQGYYTDADADVGLFVSAKAVEPLRNEQPLHCHLSTYRHIAADAYPHEAKIGALYALYRISRLQAAAAGADEAILLSSNDCIAETPGASVFAVIGGTAYTPTLETGILPSITRATALYLLESKLGIKAVECDLLAAALIAADEVFLTGTMDEIRSVQTIGHNRIGTGDVHVTTHLRDIYLRSCMGIGIDPPVGTRFFAGASHA